MMGNGKVGYLSSNREQSIGGRDIYKVVFLGAEKDFVLSKDNSPFAFEIYDAKTMFKKPPEYFTVDSSIILQGRVLDSETKTGILAKLTFIDSEKSTAISTLISDTAGNYKTRLPEKKIYGVEIMAKGYLFFLDIVDIKKVKTDVVNKDFFLQKLEVGAKVVLKNIFFETAKATLKEESFQQLNTVVEFMKDNPTLKLEISGHTDNVGGLAYNMKLSEARAKAVVTYMLSQGIDPTRLTYKGYGPNQPVAKNTTAAGKAQNRRVEFKITGK
jgi:outer membrane protein OmpA-like peptidoglycan-associated protein